MRDSKVSLMERRQLGLTITVGKLLKGVKYPHTSPVSAGLFTKDFPALLSPDFVDKTAQAIISRSGFTRGVTVHVEVMEDTLTADILEQAEKEGALGEIVAIH